MKDFILLTIPISLIAISVITDMKYRKIKNYITFPMMIAGLLLALFFSGFKGFLVSLVGLLIGGVLVGVMPGFRCGGGDIKLLAGCGAWLGIYAGDSYLLLSQQIIFLVLMMLIINWFITMALTIKKYGLGTVVWYAGHELSAIFGDAYMVRTEYERCPAAPSILIGYMATILLF